MAISTVEGLIIREVKYGDTSKILTVLSKELGKISIMAKGVRSAGNKLTAGVQLFSYNSFVLYKGKGMYTLKEISKIESFANIRGSLENLAYAVYFADIASTLIEENSIEAEQINLILTALYMLSGDKTAANLVKAVYELRALALAGMAPNLNCCGRCMKEDGLSYFDIPAGCSVCSDCHISGSKEAEMPSAILNAMKYIISCESGKLFSFSLTSQAMDYLGKITEFYSSYHLDKEFRSLKYLKNILEL